MGKSEAAISFANDQLHNFAFVWTLDCSKDLNSEYQELGRRLSKSFSEFRDIPPAQLSQRVLSFLNLNDFKQPWLLIYDNVEQPLSEKNIPQRGGYVLLTSRQKNAWASDNERIEITPFSPKEAIDLLIKITGERESQELKELVEELDFFPFAINQVGNYVKNNQTISISDYRKIYNLERSAHEAPIEKDGRYAYVLKNVWKTTFDRLLQESQKTIEWLQVCSFLHPSSIPLSWLEEWAKDPKVSEEVSRKLLNYGLMRSNRENQNLSIHRRMQDVIQYELDEDHKKKRFQEGFDLVYEILEKEAPIWKMGKTGSQACIFHALAFLGREELIASSIFLPKCFLFMTFAGNICYHGDNDRNALKFNREAVEIAEAYFQIKRTAIEEGSLKGIEREAIFAMLITSYTAIGQTLAGLGQNERSLDFCRKAHKIRFEVTGERLSLVANNCDALALAFSELGDNKAALKQYIEALNIRVSLYNENHPEVAKSYIAMGHVLSKLGNDNKLLEVSEKALEILSNFYGENHLETARGYTILGAAKMKVGNYEKALICFEKAFQIQLTYYGENDFEFGLTYSNIGWALTHMKRNEEAPVSYQKALAIYSSIYDPEHHCIQEIQQNIKSLK